MPHAGPVSVPFELELLTGATRYQSWLADAVRPYLGRRVLELGSGIGNMSRHLPLGDRLVLAESDPGLLAILEQRVPPTGVRSLALVDPKKSLAARFANEAFDTALSFNVLEHIEDEAATVRDLIELLRASPAPGPKCLVSVVPAHEWAYGEVDRAFGHYRRYSAASFRVLLERAGVVGGTLETRYLNLPGLLGWWFNGKLLGRRHIGEANVRAFETLCPIIRPIDDFLHKQLRLPFGNSLLAVYKL